MTLGGHSREELEEEEQKVRMLRRRTDFLLAVLYQDPGLNLETARDLIAEFRVRVVQLFPGDGGKFDLILLPKFDRVLRERWGAGFDRQVQ